MARVGRDDGVGRRRRRGDRDREDGDQCGAGMRARERRRRRSNGAPFYQRVTHGADGGGGNRSGAQGRGACRSTSGHGRIRGRRRGAGVPKTRGTGPREGAVALRFRVLSACRMAARDCTADRRICRQSPSGGGDLPGIVGRYRSSRCRRPVVVLRPAPQRIGRIFTPEAQARLFRDYEVVTELEARRRPRTSLDAVLPRAFAIVGQPDLPAARLERATALRVVMNVEGNFFPNVDYEACFRARHPRARLRARVCPGGRGVRARPGDRPRPRDQPRGPRVPRRQGAIRRPPATTTRSCCAARNRPRRLWQPRPCPPRGCWPVRRDDPGLRPVAARLDPARRRARPVDARRRC